MGQALTRVFLLRHEEVDSAWHGRIYGALDVPLSEAGRASAAETARVLEHVELAAVVSSGLSRTEHTAAELRASRQVQRIDDSELRELERGEWAGLAIGELEDLAPGALARWFEAPARHRPPGGESLEDLSARVRPRLAHWVASFPGRDLAIVTHGWVVRVLVCEALGASLDLAPRLDVRTGDIQVLGMRAPRTAPELLAFALDRLEDPAHRGP